MELQQRLFRSLRIEVDERALSGARRIVLGPTAFLDHAPGLVRGDDALFDRLVRELRWSEARREMYDRTVDVPRLLASIPDDGPEDPVLTHVADLLSARYARAVRRISLALYRDGRDSVAMHGDRMGDQLDDNIIAIVSLRGPRRVFDLGHGDLLVMGGSTQRDFEHGVPKVASAPPRMSVMFRS